MVMLLLLMMMMVMMMGMIFAAKNAESYDHVLWG